MEAFTETQEMKRTYLAYGVAVLILVPVFFMVPEKDKTIPLIVGGIVTFFWLVLTFLFRFRTSIDAQGIEVRSVIGRVIYAQPWSGVRTAGIHQYRPMAQNGYFGVHLYRNIHKVVNVGSKTGLMLLHRNGTTMLIGTRKPEELQAYLDYLKTKHSIRALTNE